MSRRSSATPAELVTDPGVLEPTPSLEVFGYRAVAAVGGVAVLPHRGAWLRARALDIDVRGWFDDDSGASYQQVVVHLQKGRAATEQGLSEAWARLAHGGRLLLVGGNDLGIKSAVKRLAAELDQPAEIVANRARARVVCWRRTGTSLTHPAPTSVEVSAADGAFSLATAPGVFSADAVDPGTAMLLEHLGRVRTPSRVFDPGCGFGVLGLAALRRWPDATAVLADVDQRAIACAQRNAADVGLTDRCDVVWWDAVSEPAPIERCDLALVNPPFHTGVPVDLQPARSIFAGLGEVLAPGGRALIVANRSLPWERDLSPLGRLSQLADERGYKVIQLAR